MWHTEKWGCGHTWYRDIEIQHFGDPTDIKLEHFTSEVPKSRNVMHHLEEKAAKDFCILGIDFSAIRRTRNWHFGVGNPKVPKATYIWSEVVVTRFRSSGFDILAIPGTRSRALDIESPEVAKHDIPSELGLQSRGKVVTWTEDWPRANRSLSHFDISEFGESKGQ